MVKKKGKRVGKQRLEIIENNPYCKILYCINVDELKAFDISKQAEIDPTLTLRQLKVLTGEEDPKDKFLDWKKDKKTKLYSIIWSRVVEEYINFVREAVENKYKELKALHGKELKKYLDHKKKVQDKELKDMGTGSRNINEMEHFELMLNDKSFNQRLKNNKYLPLVFKHIFYLFGRYKYFDKTIKKSFDDLSKSAGFEFEIWNLLIRPVNTFPKTEEERKEKDRKFRQLQKDYDSFVKNNQDYKDLKSLSEILRHCYWSEIETQAIYRANKDIIKQAGLSKYIEQNTPNQSKTG